ncbi:DUF6387 family protein [Microbulbifer spongiae]|uniref:DUF6387 family protein n=1 Tax=Microbulbifer spongiae TaxID=2944933 RepID=A0ABY9EEC9_9GAMM|nr:DUF6387 family protein [Microbulbifer sp. MI-G]WKD50512.1 DUF6387 family protein [Microbulbifer sp. MI-G]
MSSSFQKAGEWFRIENYKKLNECPDFTLFKFLTDRADMCSWLSYLTGGRFLTCRAIAPDLALEIEPQLIAFRESALEYKKIKFFDISDYLSCGHLTDETMDSLGWTPAWLKSQDYSCSAIRPISVGDVVRMFDSLEDGAPEGFSDEEFADDVAEFKAQCRHSENPLSELDAISFDQYLREAFEYHAGLVSLNIDLAARDEQILAELKTLLPKLRKLLSRDSERSQSPSLEEQLFLGPSSQKRDTRRIDMDKVRDYRVPALIDLYIWSIVEGESLSNADYLRLAFPGDTKSDDQMNEERIKKVCLPYAFRCVNPGLLAALDRSLERERKSHRKNSIS